MHSPLLGARLLFQPRSLFRRPGAATETVVYSFCSQGGNCADGALPEAGLVSAKGKLYGTTWRGGKRGTGTVFSFDSRSGAVETLYSFPAGRYGTEPSTPVAYLHGKLYGTTIDGGNKSCPHGCGTVFSVDLATGAEAVVYDFRGSNVDGAGPDAGLIRRSGLLYGTTVGGGAHHGGTVFSLDPVTGTDTVLHAFGHGEDGAWPIASLAHEGGILYGTTEFGGAFEWGTVFSLDPATGAERVLYSFCASESKCTDGQQPGGLIALNGTLYGMTPAGGTSGGGVVFSFDLRTGVEKVIYSFCAQQNCTDGYSPVGELLALKGILYGATTFGGHGSYSCDGGACGTVFSLDPSTGTETVLYSFCSDGDCVDGAYANGVIDIKGELYGTTGSGGAYNEGAVFGITP
ncbi:MAG TPA: choice-of-anchor tandem repeat GloVer-containing protein [Rhizomicrobium sp.]|nr:choice-of-anchor tandem repeat GloVer-containing protein [Rhizomicrobium sp.]